MGLPTTTPLYIAVASHPSFRRILCNPFNFAAIGEILFSLLDEKSVDPSRKLKLLSMQYSWHLFKKKKHK